MKAANSRLVVIDASIAVRVGSAIEVISSESRQSSVRAAIQCRELLDQVYEVCHRVIFSAPCVEEWERHAAAFARRWQTRMFGRKKIVRQECDLVPLQTRIRKKCLGDVESIVMKDAHLIAAALRGDGVVFSLDDRARHHFFTSVLTPRECDRIRWINPVQIENMTDFLVGL